MSSGLFDDPGFGRDPFEDFLARFFGTGTRRPAARVDIGRLMSGQARALVAQAAEYAAAQGGTELDTEHLLRAALAGEPTRAMVAGAGGDPDALGRRIDELGADGGAPQEPQSALTVTPAAKRALLDSHQIARAFGSSYIGPEHILLALAANPDSNAGRILAEAHLSPSALAGGQGSGGGEPGGRSGYGSGFGQPFGSGASSSFGAGPGRGPATAARGSARGGGAPTPNLDRFGRDLTELARGGGIDPVIGREEEIAQTVEVLSRRGKNNPVLIGDAGVGKTAIVEGIAQRIADGDVPDTLLGRRVVQLDLSGVVAGTRYRGDFEERLSALIDEIRAHRDELVVFIDELHTVVGAGGGGSEGGGMDAGNMLKPALARGELHIIGATTLEEYRRYIEKDAALARRFQPVLVSEPSPQDAIEILRGLRDRYEAHHQVRFTDEALVAAVELSDRYIADRFLPDKAIDLIDQTGARVRLRSKTPAGDVRELEQQLEQARRDKDQAVAAEQYERAGELRDKVAQLTGQIEQARQRRPGAGGRAPEVTAEDIAEVVARRTGIPVSRLTEEEKDRLLNLEEHLHRRVIGQDEAVAAVAEAVQRSRAGFADPDRPIGSFLFLGPTGVGKTELARALAESLFGSEERMIRFDMSEFQERHAVSRLVGAPPGYVGFEDAGQLTEAVRRQPYSLLLLDEIEKAHPDIFNILLQVLDDGRLTDSQGRTVDFKNTVLIMTSNLGSDIIAGQAGQLGFTSATAGADGASAAGSARDLRDRLMRPLREAFRPEFLNRIDEIVVFRRLERQQLRQITELLLEETRRRARGQDVALEFSPAAVDWLAERGHQPEFGARPLRRTIQREVDNRLSRLLLDGRVHAGSSVRVDVEDGRLEFRVEAGARS